MSLLSNIEIIKDMVQEAVDKGASTVEEIHLHIAEIPISQLEKSGLLTPEDAEEKKELHHQSVGQIYNAIRKINSEVGNLASEIFEALEDGKRVSDSLDRDK